MPKKINWSNLDQVNWPVQGCMAFATTKLMPVTGLASVENAFSSYNIALHVGDNEAQVLANRALLQQILPAQCKIQWLNQVHGAQVVRVEQVSEQAITADAQITNQQNIALAIMTADCLPILISARDGSEIAAIHGGWRSLAENIIANTIKQMHSPASELVAWLGPCITQSAFEVSDDVRATFTAHNSELAEAFSGNRPGHCLASLPDIALRQLRQVGVNKITHSSHCTFSEPHRYYSYRRAPITGRMVSIICRQ